MTELNLQVNTDTATSGEVEIPELGKTYPITFTGGTGTGSVLPIDLAADPPSLTLNISTTNAVGTTTTQRMTQFVAQQRFTLTSHTSTDSLSTGDTITWTDNGTPNNTTNNVDIHVGPASLTKEQIVVAPFDYDQGPPTQSGTYTLTDVPVNVDIRVVIVELQRDNAGALLNIDVAGASEYTFPAPELGDTIYARSLPTITAPPVITPTNTTIISSGDSNGLWAALRAANPGDAVLGEAGGVYSFDPNTWTGGPGGTQANNIYFGGDSDTNRIRFEGAGGTNWRNFRQNQAGTNPYPGNTHARAWWWEGVHDLTMFNFEIWYAAYWGMMLGGADNGNSAPGLACNRITARNFLVDGFSNAGVKWLNGSDGGDFQHLEIRNGDAETTYGGEPFYFGSGNDPASGSLGCTIRDFDFHHNNGELDLKRLSRGPILIERGTVRDTAVNSQGAITLGINNHDYGATDPDVTLRWVLVERITNRNFNGNGIVVAIPATIEECIVRDCVDHCIEVYGSWNHNNNDLVLRNNILIPNAGLKAIEDRGETFLNQWPNITRDGNYVPASEVQGNERAIESQTGSYQDWAP